MRIFKRSPRVPDYTVVQWGNHWTIKYYEDENGERFRVHYRAAIIRRASGELRTAYVRDMG